MIINKPHLCSKLNIWSPRYSDKYVDEGQWVVLLAKYKVHHSSSVMLIEFTKAKHLLNQRFCITRDKAQRCPTTTNGKIECYAVPMDMLETWETPQEVQDVAFSIWEDVAHA